MKNYKHLTFPMSIFLSIFFLLPLIFVIFYSFMEKGLYGGVVNVFSFDAYKQIFQRSYQIITLRTLLIALEATVITVVLALICAYAIAQSHHQTLFLSLIVLPFLTNSLIRIFAWMSILSTDGMLNNLLLKIGIISNPLSLLYNRNAVILIMVYMYLPYAILPIFSAIDSFDFSLLEASRDLGATKFQGIRKVLFPSIKNGINTSILFTFIPAFGAYTISLLVGGKDSYLLGNLIVDQITKTRNWPLAAAFSLLLTLVSIVGILYIYRRPSYAKKSKKYQKGK